MTDRALSENVMLSSLRDIDLPAHAAGGLAADIAITLGLAGFAALAVAGLLCLMSLQRVPAARDTLQLRLEDARALPEEDRRLALLHLLRDRDPDRYYALVRDLYRPNGGPDADQLEKELARLV